jgi:hypothetical protein
MTEVVHFIPIVTTVMAFAFAVVMFRRYAARRSGPHLLWWACGIALYGVGTLTEASVTLFGWSEPLVRAWYISGALLPGIGGTATRMGHVEVLYVTELIGLTLIWLGYRWNVRVPAPTATIGAVAA